MILVCFFSNPDLNNIKLGMSLDLTQISYWFNSNKVTVHPAKSNLLIILPKINKSMPNINISLNNFPIPQCSSVKYHGVTLDATLKFDNQISSIENKLSRAVGILCKVRHYMPQKTLEMLYYALIHLHLLYGLSIWGSTYPSYLKKLNILQNKAIKLISRGFPWDLATPYYSYLKILKLENLFKIEVGKLVHFHFQRKLSLILSNLFQPQCNISKKNTRSSKKPNLLLACLRDQNKSGFFGGQAFIRPIRAIWKVIKKLWLARKKPTLQKSHFWFDRVNRFFMSHVTKHQDYKAALNILELKYGIKIPPEI